MRGPEVLSNAQKSLLLGDPSSLSTLHFQVWTSEQAHPAWFAISRGTGRRCGEPAARALTPAAAG
jgi:membrane glycosyltransferase